MPDIVQYRTISGSITARVEDGADPGHEPDIEPMTGTVVFTPELTGGKMVAFPGTGQVIYPKPVECTLQGGLIKRLANVGGAETWVDPQLFVTVDDRADQAGWHYRISFKVMQADQSVEYQDRRVVIEAGDGDLDIATLIASATVVRSPSIAPIALIRSVAEEVVDEHGGGGGMPAGVVPIFPTLAEAQAWEAANPGRVALTLEEGGEEPDPDPDPDPEPGEIVASDDFAHADGYITGKPTPVGNRMWVHDIDRMVVTNLPASGGGNVYGQPNVRDGRYISGNGYFATGLDSLRVSFDYNLVTTDTASREVRVGVGGYEFRIANQVNLYRMFSPDGSTNGQLIHSVSAGEAFKPSGHCTVEYDGITATMLIDDEIVLERVGDGRTSGNVGFSLAGRSSPGTGDTVGDSGTLNGNSIDNLTVETL